MRSFAVGSEAEGCVADDDTGALYVSEENDALWRYSAEPGGGTTREAVDVLTAAGGHLVNDIEGVTLVDQADGDGYIIVSAQSTWPTRTTPTSASIAARARQRLREHLPGLQRNHLRRLRPYRRRDGHDG